MIRLTLRELEVFVTTARIGGITAAGETLGLSQSAASGALAELERRLGVTLFDRIGRRIQINEHGRWLLPQAETLLAQARDIEARFRGNAPARLRLAASSTIGNRVLPDLLGALLAQEPESRAEISIGNTHDAIAAVADYRADFGLIEGICHDARVLAEPWLADELVIVARPDHDWAGREIGIAALAGAQWILREQGSGTREVLEAALAPLIGSPKVALELGTSEAVKGAVRAGLGLACLSRRTVATELARGELATLAVPGLDLSRRFYLIRARDKVLTQGAQRFHALCLARFAAESTASDSPSVGKNT
ncbi:LysR family transcriptional regulator [Jeongeupia sp. HS-3]|uniref:LysR family transcriptional regulator n=1 Tax=Jeongeupia sp. HS-3 TaxID=1009682 RepID=UPI0018A48492|nr:LysR family transcriptional regulator [Jeongeupia sp. HS-3]BCL77243.1 LysR family transcriptional regulator [Jeongeupia sp. HS-3]